MTALHRLGFQVGAIRRGLLPAVAFAVVTALSASWRFRCPQGSRQVRCGPGSYLLAIWHQNLLAGILAQSGRPHCVMVSRSRDGEWVSDLCTRLGHRVLRGSSRRNGVERGGREAKDDMVTALRSGLPGALTVDGPKGPAHQVKPGIVDIAGRSGRCVVPYLPLPRRYWSLRSWDAMRIPMPFTRIDVHYGAALSIPADADALSRACFQQQLAEALQALERNATRSRARRGTPA